MADSAAGAALSGASAALSGATTAEWTAPAKYTFYSGQFFGMTGFFFGVAGYANGLIANYKRDNPDPTPHAVVTVAVALEGPKQHGFSYGGEVTVRAYGYDGELVGRPHKRKISQGNSNYDIYYKPYRGMAGRQAPYALFTGGKDAICIAWTEMRWPDRRSFKVTGDWGHPTVCGGAGWGYSNLVAGYDAKGQPYAPYCTWIDQDGNQPSTAFQVFYPAYSQMKEGHIPTVYDICNSVAFRVSHVPKEKTIIYDTDPFAGNTMAIPQMPVPDMPRLGGNGGKKQGKRGQATPDDRLITSNWPHHNATELCESPLSRGPSIVSEVEGKFCDMNTRTVYPLCGNGFSEPDQECFNRTTHAVEVADETGRVLVKRAKQFAFSEHMDWQMPAAKKPADVLDAITPPSPGQPVTESGDVSGNENGTMVKFVA